MNGENSDAAITTIMMDTIVNVHTAFNSSLSFILLPNIYTSKRLTDVLFVYSLLIHLCKVVVSGT